MLARLVYAYAGHHAALQKTRAANVTRDKINSYVYTNHLSLPSP